jgi:murein DD-endopeptidase MepM/ murein hydrolase activator NlpD
MIVVASVAATLTATAGLALGQDGTSTRDLATAQGGGTSSGGRSGGDSLRLKAESAAPGKVFFYGKNRATYRFTIDGNRRRNLKIQAVSRRSWRVVKVWRRDNVEPGTHKIQWSGNNRHGKATKKGTYLFRIRTKHGAEIDRSRAKGDDRSFSLYREKFPVRGRHTYGDGYGAPRSGHVHQGQDVLADCGKRVVAARGGKVQYSGYQAGGAGYYVVVDGKSTGHDYVYMHLQRRDRTREGKRVRTGQKIGRVGHTGAASACHLHFELWSKPGWYTGGHAMRSVTKHLKEWDRWS